MKLTICTPTFNRKHTLSRLFDSLAEQTNRNFEWVVVDDGSTDGTEELIAKLQKKADFSVRYYKQKNSGKHVALNLGVQYATGDLFFIVDSDDWLPCDSVTRILGIEQTIHGLSGYAGIAGVKRYSNGELVGTTFGEEYIDCTSLQRRQYRILGDKAEVFYTEILRQYPFPVFEGENFLTESVVWYRIANAGYKLRWTNNNLYFCEYLEEGLSHTTGKCTANFEGFKLTVREELTYQEIPFFEKLGLLVACGGIAIEKKESIFKVAKEIESNCILLGIVGFLGYLVKKLRK